MKYIRTKDGIYEIDETTILTSLPPCYAVIKPTDKHYAISQKNVIKEADTIEELCDEVVVVYPNGSHSNHFCYDYKSFYESIEGQVGNIGDVPYTKENLNEYDIYEIYGAIWTDKGLIYVAKMNEKGELELL